MKTALILVFTASLTILIASQELPSCGELWSDEFRAILDSAKDECGGINFCFAGTMAPIIRKMAKEKKDINALMDAIVIKNPEKGSWQEAVIQQTKGCKFLLDNPAVCFFKASNGKCSVNL